MARRTQIFTQLPWTGGLNLAVDPGVVPANDLVVCDNAVFSESSARIRRSGYEYFDFSAAIPQVLARKSTTTTRTLIFSEDLQPSNNEKLVQGEKITVASTGNADYDGDFTVASITTENPSDQTFADGDVDTSNDTITISSHGFYTGMLFQLTSTGTLPGGLSTTTDYYVIVSDSDTIQIASSLNNALAGTAVDITSASGGGTHTVDVTAVSNNAITYTAGSSLGEALTTDNDAEVSRNWKFIGLHDYWYTDSGIKTQLLVGISNEPKWYKYDTNGNREEIPKASGGTSLSAPTKATFSVLNNKLIVGFDGAPNTPKIYDGAAGTSEWDDLGGSPPNFSISQIHLGRLFTNDKDDLDRLHYTSPGNIEEWNGTGDSAAIDLFPQDGDPRGITAILPPFKNRLFIGKKTKVIELLGDAPENFDPNEVTTGIGIESHRASASIDYDDIYFLSDRGVHSLIATATEGGFSSNFLSNKIQKTFNNDFQESRLQFTSAAYIPQLNSYALNISNSDVSTHDEIWLFNVVQQEWYRWPSVSAEAMARRLDTDATYKLVFGTNEGRIIQAQSSSKRDFSTDNVSYTIKSGQIYPDGNPYTLKAFKSVALYFKPRGEISITVNATIDNLGSQSRTINPNTGVTALGSTFILGTSVLGGTGALAPFTVPIDGYGRGIELEITSTGGNQDIELYGYSVEYELADIKQETA